MIVYTQYNTTTGEIISVGQCQEEVVDLLESAGVGVILESANLLTDYVDLTVTPTITARPTITPTLSATEMQTDGGYNVSITGIPTGWTYTLPNGVTGTTDGTTVDLRAIVPGLYTISFAKWPYIPYEATINAVSTVL